MENKIKYAFVEGVVPGIGPDGRMRQVESGGYLVADLDGMPDGIIMLRPSEEASKQLMAKVQEDTVQVVEVLEGPHSYEWAKYYREHPSATRSIAEQLGRRPFWNTVGEH